jgi:hypothetical protein
LKKKLFVSWVTSVCIILGLAACNFGAEAPGGKPIGASQEETPPKEAAPPRPAVPKEQWKVKDADSAKTFLQNCDPVKEGSLTLIIEQEATPESPVWWVGLQIPNGPLLDRCSVDAETQKLFCRGDTCP